MSTTIDSLAIEIQSNSSGAIGDIERLAKALEGIKKSTVTKTAVNNLKSLTSALKELTPVSSNANKLGALAKSLKELTTVGSLRGITNQLKELPSAMRGLSGINVDGLDTKLESVADALKPLAEVKGKGFNDAITGLTKIGKVTEKLDSPTINRFVAKIKELDDKLGPVSTKLIAVGSAIKDVNTTAKSASTGVGKLSNTVNATTLNISSLVTIANSFISALRPVITLLSNSISAAIEWDGIEYQFGNTFGEQADEYYEKITKITDALKLNKQTFMENSAMAASMLKGFGVNSADAREMGVGYTELAYDIWAAFNNVYKSFDGADGAMAAVRSAIAGEVEPIRRAGFTIVDSQLKITAANYGIAYSSDKATEAQKSYLRYLTLVDQAYTKGIVGAYAHEMSNAEGQMRTFSQQLKSLSQTFGSVFLPVLTEVMPWLQAFVELLGEAIIAVANFFGVDIQKVDFSGSSSGIDGIGGSADDAKDSIDGATNALKELKNATTGIDELNIISPQSSNGGGSSSTPDSGYDGLDIESLWNKSIFDNIQSEVDEIKESIKGWLPIIESVGIALGLLGAAKLLSDITDAIGKMDVLSKAIFGIGTALIEATLVFAFADNYLEEGNLASLFGEALTTALGGYILYKTWGTAGLTVGIAVSVVAQLAAITLNLADGGVGMDDPELWIQSAFTTLTGAAGGGLIFKKWVSSMPNAGGKGMLFGALAAISLTLAAITIGGVAADGDLGLAEAVTGALSMITGGAAGAALVSFLGIATGGTGFLIGAAAMLAVNLVGATVAAKNNLKEEITAGIAEAFAGDGEFTLEDVSVEVGVKLSEITDRFGDFEQYRKIIDGTKGSIKNVTSEIDNMAGAIAKDSDAFNEYVPKIIESIETLESETRAKLEAIRENLISALAGGLGEGYENVGQYVDTVNDVIDDTMTRLDELEVILADSAKVGSQEWTNAWSEYKTLIGEAITVTEDFSKKVGAIDWSGIALEDGSLDSGALKTYFSEITTAMGDTKKEIEVYYSGIESDLRTLRDNAVKLYGEGSDPVVKLDSLIDTNKENWDTALGEVNAIAQSTFDNLQRDVIYKASQVVANAQEEYKKLSWWEKLMYPSEESYVQDALSQFQTGYIDPISTEMASVFEELGIDGSVWSSDAIHEITDALFDMKYAHSDLGSGEWVYTYKDSAAGAIIKALNGVGQDAKPYALQVAKNVGLDLGNGLGDQYSLIYDKTTGAVTGVKDAVNDTTVDMTPDLKAAMTELGIDMSDGVIKGAQDGMKADKKSWLDWAIWPWNWFKEKNEIKSPSKLFARGGKYLTDGLKNGMETNSLKDKLSNIWSTAKTWWDKSKSKLASYTPSIGSIKDKVSSAWTTAKNWWNNTKTGLSSYTPTIGSIKDKLSNAWTSAKNWWSNSKGTLSHTPSIGSIKDKVSSAWTTAKNWWNTSKVGMSYTPTIGSIKDKLSTAWTTAKNWWNNNVKLSIPSLSFKVTYTNTGLNWTQSAIVKALGLSGWPKLSFAANGGIFDMGSLVWAGESGPEIVANAGGGKTGVMNVQQMSEAVYEGVYSAVVAAMKSSGGNGNGAQAVNVYLDGKQITATVERRQRERGATIMGSQVYSY